MTTTLTLVMGNILFSLKQYIDAHPLVRLSQDGNALSARLLASQPVLQSAVISSSLEVRDATMVTLFLVTVARPDAQLRLDGSALPMLKDFPLAHQSVETD